LPGAAASHASHAERDEKEHQGLPAGPRRVANAWTYAPEA
jgi:hypothetical protein